MEGTKHDSGKEPIWLLPKSALLEVTRVLAFGAKKYDAWDWAAGMDYSRLLSASQRHIWAFEEGQDKDPETNLSHLAHAICCLLFLLTYTITKTGRDDRHAKQTKNKAQKNKSKAPTAYQVFADHFGS